MTSHKPDGRPLSRLVQQFADLEAREWAALDAAGITKPEQLRRSVPKTRQGRLAGVTALSCSGSEGPLRDPAIVLERIEKLPNDRRGWKKRNKLWRHLMAAMSARLTIEAIEDRDLARAVENGYKAGVNHLRHLAEIGDKITRGSGRDGPNPRHARWLAMDKDLRKTLKSERARTSRIGTAGPRASAISRLSSMRSIPMTFGHLSKKR